MSNFDEADTNTKDNTGRSRAALSSDLTELIRTRSADLESVGFSPEMARFDCLITVKIIVDELYDEFNVGHARKAWYREYVRVGFEKP